MKVSGLQNPTQHSASIAHVTPASLQAAERHRLMLHVPSQQSLCSMHDPAVAAQELERHRLPMQLEPVQQSAGSPQFWPGAPQVPSPTHRLLRQVFEQQTDALAHPSPLAAQPHTPLRHSPSQQSLLNRHISPAGLQGSRHCPPTHEPWQHSALSPQLARNAVHGGDGGRVVGPHATTDRQTQARAT